jgi:hypothetical protein
MKHINRPYLDSKETSNIHDRISDLWDVLNDLPQKPLPTAMVDNSIVSRNIHSHQSITGTSTRSNVNSTFAASEARAKLLSQQKDTFIIRSDISKEKPQCPPSELRFLETPGLYKQITHDDFEFGNPECVVKMKLWEERKTVRKVLSPVAMKLGQFVSSTSKEKETIVMMFHRSKNSSNNARYEDPRQASPAHYYSPEPLPRECQLQFEPEDLRLQLLAQSKEPPDRPKGTAYSHTDQSSTPYRTSFDVNTTCHSKLYSASSSSSQNPENSTYYHIDHEAIEKLDARTRLPSIQDSSHLNISYESNHRPDIWNKKCELFDGYQLNSPKELTYEPPESVTKYRPQGLLQETACTHHSERNQHSNHLVSDAVYSMNSMQTGSRSVVPYSLSFSNNPPSLSENHQLN